MDLSTLMKQLVGCKSIERSLSLILGEMEKSINFQSLGVFERNLHKGTFKLKIGRNISHTYAKNTEFRSDSTIVKALYDLQLLDYTDQNLMKFENDYSHLLVSPFHYDKDVLGFMFIDKADEKFTTNEIESFEMFCSLSSMVIELYKQKHEIEDKTEIDPFSGLLTAKCFNERIQQRIFDALRYDSHLSLILVQIRNYAKLYDIYGNAKIEQLIKSLAKIFGTGLRKNEVASLVFNDTFGFMLENTDPQNNVIVVNRLEKQIAELSDIIKIEDFAWGIAVHHEGISNFEEFLNVAEACVFEARRKKNSTVCYNSELE